MPALVRTFLHCVHSSSLVLILTTFCIANRSHAQCDASTQGVLTYCNSFHNGSVIANGYFVAFRVVSLNGDTLDVVDLTGQVPTNQGKRIDDINTDLEPENYSIQQLMIGGGLDTVEYWYFGPFNDGTPFDIALVDPNGICDTVFVASGTFNCTDGFPNTDPMACTDDVVPLYYLDFSLSTFTIGGGGGVNENVDEVFLVMERTRERT